MVCSPTSPTGDVLSDARIEYLQYLQAMSTMKCLTTLNPAVGAGTIRSTGRMNHSGALEWVQHPMWGMTIMPIMLHDTFNLSIIHRYVPNNVPHNCSLFVAEWETSYPPIDDAGVCIMGAGDPCRRNDDAPSSFLGRRKGRAVCMTSAHYFHGYHSLWCSYRQWMRKKSACWRLLCCLCAPKMDWTCALWQANIEQQSSMRCCLTTATAASMGVPSSMMAKNWCNSSMPTIK